MSRVSLGIVSLFFIVLFSLESYSQKPDSICGNAGVFCSAQSMKGPWDLPDTLLNVPTFNICTNGGQSQNAMFFAFVPNSNTVTITIKPSLITPRPNKNPNKIGYQYGIVDRCDFDDPDLKYMVCDGGSKIITNRTLSANNFIPGHTYYLFVDGWEGAKVYFELDVVEGIGGLTIEPIDSFVVTTYGNDTIAKGDTISGCIGSKLTFEPLGSSNAEFYTWQTQDTLEMSDSSKLVYTLEKENTIYKICATPMTDCDSADSSCVYIVIDTVETVVLDTANICESALNTSYYMPLGWHGQAIDTAGTFFYNYVDSIGCKVKEQVTVNKVEEPVVQYDSIICDSDKFLKDTMLRDTIFDIYGCNTYVLKHLFYFSFTGFVKELKCNNDSFKIEIDLNGFDRSQYNNILVNWYNSKNEVVKTSFSFEPFIVKDTGVYYPIVTLFQKGKECSYTLAETVIKAIPSANFEVDKKIVCSSDTVFFEISDYIDTLIYDVNTDMGNITDLSNGKYYIIWNNNDKGSCTISVSTSFKNCSFSEEKKLTIQEKIVEPVIDCVDNTNNSVIIAWDSSGCVASYEVWIDSEFYHAVNVAHDTIKGLTYGQKIGIEIKAISGCECEGQTYKDSCSTIACPDRDISIGNLPGSTCFDEFEDSVKLSYIADTTGEAIWGGDIINSDGIIYKNVLDAGEHNISFKFKVGDCSYKIDTSLVIYPKLDVEWTVKEISCYNTSDGVLEINPVPDLKEYALMLNETKQETLTIDSLTAGDYNFILTDSNGCNYTASFNLEQPEEPVLEIIGEEKIKFNTEYKYYLDLDISNSDSTYWYKDDSLICNGKCDTIELEVGATQSNFNLCAVVYYDSLCNIEICKEIKIDRKFDIFIPNIFTPNFDGLNDYFTISSTNGLSIMVKTFRVYNRWGEEVFYNSDFVINSPKSNQGWNGLIRGEKALSGVYVYYIEVVSDDGEISKYYGDITLLR